ncbi:MAG TPA: Uma2 family endonuclease [Actinocrinis sp.]|uniref:Uma2 family endonuclease n=1 Tax=Actinocrinis sp. TaxID=1920516 RepID=UPI002DDD24DC|nr:Uma2 family endonuclease [Actinocrinis sp.]HEV2347421.1 Uma2 family endonuclease [Actinocrinis sp.]
MSVAVDHVHETELLDPHAQLKTFWEELDIPHGWRAEILEGTVVVTPPPAFMHNRAASRLIRILAGAIPDEWDIYPELGIRLASTGDLYIPDLTICPPEVQPTEGKVVLAEHTLLVVEITSPANADHDRKRKLWGYAHGLVPLYLLIDPHASDGPHVALFSKPDKGIYLSMTRVPYGDPITLPAPFDLKIDTDQFPRK